MPWKRRVTGGVLAVAGYMLSPLSWWNDAFVNLPLALAFAWLVSLSSTAASRDRVFQISLVVGYWLTNVIGFVLMHKGAKKMVSGAKQPYTRRAFLTDIGVSLAYTVLILLLVQFGVLKPIASYFPNP